MSEAKRFEPRSRARRRALQAVYQWQMTGQDPRQILEQFHSAQDMSGVDEAHFETLLLGISSGSAGLDQELQPFLDRPMEQVDLMEQVVLRIGAFELLNCPESPFRVVVDECVDLAHRFGSEQGHAYVNAVLDKAAKEWRPLEAGKPVTS
jgi:N utilization substance protein B